MSTKNQFTIERSTGSVTVSASPLIAYNDIVPFSVAITDNGTPNPTALRDLALGVSLRLGSPAGEELAACTWFSLSDGVKSGRFVLSTTAQERLAASDGSVSLEFFTNEAVGTPFRYQASAVLSLAGRLLVKSVSADYQAAPVDVGTVLLHPSADTAARTITIPAGLPLGRPITFVNQNGAGVITITSATDTLRLAGTGATGNRSLAANGIATATKIAASEWIISGTGLS